MAFYRHITHEPVLQKASEIYCHDYTLDDANRTPRDGWQWFDTDDEAEVHFNYPVRLPEPDSPAHDAHRLSAYHARYIEAFQEKFGHLPDRL